MSRLPVNKTFQENVHGMLQAHFVMKNGEPDYSEDDDAKCYWMQLEFLPDKQVAQKIEDVFFFLDETYLDPLRLADKKRDGSYSKTISSYGDFVVTAEVTIAGRPFRQQMWLSEMLRAAYSDPTTDPAIVQAIRTIEAN